MSDETATTPIQPFYHQSGVQLIEIPVGDDMPSPWHLIDMPKAGKAKHE